MAHKLRIGTRESKLATWQANYVRNLFKSWGVLSDLVYIKSKGDLDHEKPIDQMGTTGVFTKELDHALLNDKIDIAVHSLKDVPTIIPEGMEMGAVLKRSSYVDVLVTNNYPDFLTNTKLPATIATGSLRRKAQWLHRFPNHNIIGIRGNVDTRLSKLRNGQMDGTILSQAGIQRLNIQLKHAYQLDWMIPAPAQGVIGVFYRSGDQEAKNILASINDPVTEITSHAERQLLQVLEGGCTAPIGALAVIKGRSITLRACLHNAQGTKEIRLERDMDLKDFHTIGKLLAQDILKNGGIHLIEEIKKGD